MNLHQIVSFPPPATYVRISLDVFILKLMSAPLGTGKTRAQGSLQLFLSRNSTCMPAAKATAGATRVFVSANTW